MESHFLPRVSFIFRKIFTAESGERNAVICDGDNTTAPHISASPWKYVSSVYYVSTAETNFYTSWPNLHGICVGTQTRNAGKAIATATVASSDIAHRNYRTSITEYGAPMAPLKGPR